MNIEFFCRLPKSLLKEEELKKTNQRKSSQPIARQITSAEHAQNEFLTQTSTASRPKTNYSIESMIDLNFPWNQS